MRNTFRIIAIQEKNNTKIIAVGMIQVNNSIMTKTQMIVTIHLSSIPTQIKINLHLLFKLMDRIHIILALKLRPIFSALQRTYLKVSILQTITEFKA